MTTDPEIEQFVLIDNHVIDTLENDLKTAIDNENVLMDTIINLQGKLDKIQRDFSELKIIHEKTVADLTEKNIMLKQEIIARNLGLSQIIEKIQKI